MLVEAVLLSGLTMADVKYLQMLTICFCYVVFGAFFRMADQSCSPRVAYSGLGLGSEPGSASLFNHLIYLSSKKDLHL